MRVSALRRSLRVPPERMLRRKARSDAEPPVAFGKAEKVESSDACKEEARSSRVATWDADWEITGADVVVESGGRKLNQSGVRRADSARMKFIFGVTPRASAWLGSAHAL